MSWITSLFLVLNWALKHIYLNIVHLDIVNGSRLSIVTLILTKTFRYFILCENLVTFWRDMDYVHFFKYVIFCNQYLYFIWKSSYWLKNSKLFNKNNSIGIKHHTRNKKIMFPWFYGVIWITFTLKSHFLNKIKLL